MCSIIVLASYWRVYLYTTVSKQQSLLNSCTFFRQDQDTSPKKSIHNQYIYSQDTYTVIPISYESHQKDEWNKICITNFVVCIGITYRALAFYWVSAWVGDNKTWTVDVFHGCKKRISRSMLWWLVISSLPDTRTPVILQIIFHDSKEAYSSML